MVTKKDIMVIADLDKTELKNYPKLALKLNAEFRSMGFKKVFAERNELNVDSLYKELTLVIAPTLDRYEFEYFDIHGINTEDLIAKLKTKKGYTQIEYFNQFKLNFSTTPKGKVITSNIDGYQFDIGYYLSERNIVVLYLPVFVSDLRLIEGNAYLFDILALLKEWMVKNKIKAKDMKKIIEDRTYNNFLEFISKDLANLQSSLASTDRNIIDYSTSITEFMKQRLVYNKKIEATSKMLTEMSTTLDTKIKEIKSLACVKSVTLDEEGIKVEYKDIIKVNLGQKLEYPIGRFSLTLLPSRVRLNNIDSIIKGGMTFHHPHAKGSDQICFGEGKTQIYNLLGDFKYKEAVMFMLLFLKSYNPNDNYMRIEEFIAIREKRDGTTVLTEIEKGTLNTNIKLSGEPIEVDDEEEEDDYDEDGDGDDEYGRVFFRRT